MDKVLQGTGWKRHSAKNPFYTQPGPIEVITHGGERFVLKTTKGKRSHSENVAVWRPMNAALWVE